MNKKEQLNEQLQDIILSYCEFPDNSWTLEFYKADLGNMVEEIKASVKKAVVEALED